MTISYEDAAAVILDNLEHNGRYSRERVGIALPPGMTAHKKMDFQGIPQITYPTLH